MPETGGSVWRRSRRALGGVRDFFALPRMARSEYVRDQFGLPDPGLGVRDAIDAVVNWIGMAQDHSSTADGGVASYYSLVSGWSESYPETTGYIIPTLLDYASRFERDDARDRARRMLDWLVSIQFPEGGFQGGTIGAQPLVPVTFNTGQILIGLAAGAREFGEIYERPMRAAADWLVGTQDSDGCWRSHPSPFTSGGEKTYETHVSWGLIEAHGLAPDRGYADAALAQIGWALTQQRENGWFEQCCLTDPTNPLTHTLAYALRGCLAALELGPDTRILEACVRTADGLLGAMGPDGFIPGRLNPKWEGPDWSCLTGTAQIGTAGNCSLESPGRRSTVTHPGWRIPTCVAPCVSTDRWVRGAV